jgi:hypothetical protein
MWERFSMETKKRGRPRRYNQESDRPVFIGVRLPSELAHTLRAETADPALGRTITDIVIEALEHRSERAEVTRLQKELRQLKAQHTRLQKDFRRVQEERDSARHWEETLDVLDHALDGLSAGLDASDWSRTRKRLLALCHPDKWSQGQPASLLAHEMAVLLNR